MPALPSRRRVKIWARAIEPDCYEGSILNSLIICLDNGVHFKVRNKRAINNHIFSPICGFVQLQKLSFADVINNCYSVQRNLFNDVMASFIDTFMPNMNHLNPKFRSVVNA